MGVGRRGYQAGSCLTLPRGTGAAAFGVVRPLHSPPHPHSYTGTRRQKPKALRAYLCLRALPSEAGWRPPGFAPQPQAFRAWRWRGLPAPHLGAANARAPVTAKASPRSLGLLPRRPSAQMELHLLGSPAIWREKQEARACSCDRDPDRGSPGWGQGWSAAPLPTALAPPNACHPQGPPSPPALSPLLGTRWACERQAGLGKSAMILTR